MGLVAGSPTAIGGGGSGWRWQWPAVLVAWRRALTRQLATSERANTALLRAARQCLDISHPSASYFFCFSPFLSLSLRTAVLPMANGAVRDVCVAASEPRLSSLGPRL